LTLASGASTAPAAVAVFGSSEPLQGEESYELARRLGGLLAGAGFDVVTGAYGGVMEAASRGAREALGRTVGVTCEIFGARKPNAFIDRAIPCPDLFDRTRRLIELSHAFVVLPGKAGTLAELSFLWALQRAGCLDREPVLLLGLSLSELMAYLKERNMLERSQLQRTRTVGSPEEAVRTLIDLLGRRES